ncbi:response regulator [Peptococcaceae bacterium]|nr:response regulator [Peptococcaceae bacterium]
MKKETINVLIVDDHAGIRYLLGLLIEDVGHKTFTATNGLEAVELVRQSGFDLIFMDLCMPVMDGLKALEKIKLIAPDTEVVIVTADNNESNVNEAMKKGAFKFIAKPFENEEITGAIEEIIYFRQIAEAEKNDNRAL